MSKDLILIVGLFNKHYIVIKNQLNPSLDQYEIRLWGCEKNKSRNPKQLTALSRRSHTIFGIVGKMGHNTEEIIKNANKLHYQPITGGMSQLIKIINSTF